MGRARKGIIVGFLASLALATVVFSPVAINEIRADILAKQISNLDEYISNEYYDLLVSDGYTYLGGNGEMMIFGATSVFLLRGTDKSRNELVSKLEKMAIIWGDCKKCAKIKIFKTDSFLVVNLNVGPFNAWFDWRYW